MYVYIGGTSFAPYHSSHLCYTTLYFDTHPHAHSLLADELCAFFMYAVQPSGFSSSNLYFMKMSLLRAMLTLIAIVDLFRRVPFDCD